MNIPPKPWEEAVGSMSNLPPTGNPLPYVSNTERLQSYAIPHPASGGGGSSAMTMTPSVGPLSSSSSVAPPPLPPRHVPVYSAYNRTGYNRPLMPYSSYTSPYSSYGSGSYYSPYNSYGYGGMSSYGGYGNRFYGGGMYNGNSYGSNGEVTFTQMAEESSASAFQSIESFVSAFGSISAMLESTFHALYSSFRAVVGVADHLGRVKQILSALAMFRFFRWVFRRVLYLIGISKIKPEQFESLWSTMSESSADLTELTEHVLKSNSRPSSWPIIMFLGFIFAGPYLMWKLICSFNLNPENKVDRKWASGNAEHFVAVAEYDFSASADQELTMKRGNTIRLAPAKQQPPNVKGWVMASDGVKIGLVPTNYIKVMGKRSANPVSNGMTSLPLPQMISSNNNTSQGVTRNAGIQPDIIVTSPQENQTSTSIPKE